MGVTLTKVLDCQSRCYSDRRLYDELPHEVEVGVQGVQTLQYGVLFLVYQPPLSVGNLVLKHYHLSNRPVATPVLFSDGPDENNHNWLKHHATNFERQQTSLRRSHKGKATVLSPTCYLKAVLPQPIDRNAVL
jgi:hypothetical protein